MLQSKLDIVVAEQKPLLTTLANVKSEINVTTNEFNAIITRKIAEASGDIIRALGFAVVSETVQETFWHEAQGLFLGARLNGPDTLFLRRTPITAITSVTLDDDVLDPSEYRLDGETGQLYRLDETSGYPRAWWFCKSILVLYTGGYVLPGQQNATLPPAIEGMTIDLVKDFWASRGRDPTLRSISIPGVSEKQFWVGSVGDPELLPPTILARLALLRRPRYAVA